ncbi:cytochrome b/b6 domain-containing protein [Phenylobacterium sp.]|uniref:cytochrome b/b6 domain-containing protein n=1 Tax=Phenylobacterium sp. TaxID=1871053 RepID=UPI003D2B47EE
MTETSFPRPASLKVWDLPTRLFHWALVAAIVLAFLSSEEDSALAQWHQAAGWIAGVLIVFRLVWGFLGGEHARFTDFLRPERLVSHVGDLLRRRPAAELGHNPLGALAVVAMLALVAGSVVTGITLLTGGGEDLHEALAYGLLAVIGVHVVGVIVMSFATRENLVRAMVTGRKPSDRHPGAADAKPAAIYALPLAGLAVAAAVAGAIRIDPQAFQPHAHAEAGEGGEHAALDHANHDDDD